MQVITSRIGTPEMERTLVDNVQQQREEPLAQMLARAADRVARDVEETWKRANLLDFDQRNRLQVEVPIDGLERWVTVRERLDGVARIERFVVTAMTRTLTRVEMAYFGAPEQLALALRQNDLVLERKNPDGSTRAVDTRRGDGDAAGAGGDSLSPGATGRADDPNAWVLRAADMRTESAQAGQGGGQSAGGQSGGGASASEPSDQPAQQ
jgi:hypothetical protein